MNYCFAKHIILRMPVKDPADYNLPPQHFLDDKYFLAAIKIATNGFFAVLESKSFKADALTDKETKTLNKYINRYCFRPTPFGLFSSISLIEWDKKSNVPDLPPNFTSFIRAAMPFQNALNAYSLGRSLLKPAKLESNPFIYRVLNEYRFLRTGIDETGKHRYYQLQSIAFSKILKDLLTLCRNGCSLKEITGYIVSAVGCERAEAADYAKFLIDAQFLVHMSRMPITGPDQLQYLSEKLIDGASKVSFLHATANLRVAQKVTSPANLTALAHELQSLLPGQDLRADSLSVILKREAERETLGVEIQKALRDGITALHLLSAEHQPARISEFVSSFQQHFEGQSVPLLKALDPEAGIGYQSPETEKNNPLLDTLEMPSRERSRLTITWSTAQSILMEAWLKDRSAVPVIKLHEDDLEKLQQTQNPSYMLGMSVLFRISDEKVYIENAGGINAPALMGRFTVADDSITEAAQEMARALEALNPGVIFAELLHLADPHIDNVNRRANIYYYELPITASSTLPIGRQLTLSDLYVKVVDNKVMLFSETHQKFVIPRLTSAYNHSLNKLPLFRFLADLSYQYGRSNLGLEMPELFPGLGFYPRVEFKGTILSLATWIITSAQINRFINETDRRADAFYKLSSEIGLPRFFSLVEGDQELVIDRESDRDIDLLINNIKQNEKVRFSEFLEQPKIKQYNTYLLPTEPIHLPNPVHVNISKPKAQRKYLPGSSWLYLKIYAPKIGANRLLLKLAPLLQKRYAGHQITRWFFIRYEDHAPHIRLRLQVDPGSINEILLAFKSKLEGPVQQYVIREFQIDVYNRELERYTAGGIENTERFFWVSSVLVMQYLKRPATKPFVSPHLFAMYSGFVMINTFITDLDEQLDFTQNSFQQMLPEFADKSIKVDLDKKYRELSQGISVAFQTDDAGLFSSSVRAGHQFKQSLNLLQKHVARHRRIDYLRSIIHMHLNRIFTDESRKQEMICYYLLHKYLLSVKGRKKDQLKMS